VTRRDPDGAPLPFTCERATALPHGGLWRYYRQTVLDDGGGFLGELVIVERVAPHGLEWAVGVGLSSVRPGRCERFGRG
jgi:hypothetical protein